MTRFRHYKGGIYELVCEARMESDLAPVVVYRSEDGHIWVRPKELFFGTVVVGGEIVARFQPID